MAELNGGQIAAKQLRAAGIDTLFGVVAGPMIEVFAGAQEEGLRVVGCRHEENAAFMASAWGYQTGKPGVIVAGSGPAVTNCVTPMHVATESCMPLLVLGGSSHSATRGLGGFQEADQLAFAAPGCKWIGQVDSTERIPVLMHLAMGKAVAGRPGAVYLDFPGQVVSKRIPEERVQLRDAPEVTRPHPDPAAIERLADMGIPYVCSPMARGVIPDDHAGFMNAARSSALAGADAILMVGGRFNWIFGMGRRFAHDARIAQIDVEAEELWSGAGLELGVVADAAVAAEQLVAALEGRELRARSSGWLDDLAAQRKKNEAGLARAMSNESVPINPYRLVREVRDALPRDAIISVDGETIMGICRAILPSYGGRSRMNSGTTGCMGTGAPYALGAALAHPDRRSVAVLGDYAFGAAAMCVETAARVGARPVYVVANNEGIAGHLLQDRMLPPDSPRIAALLPAHYEKLAEMVDGHAERVDRPEEIRPALERALAADRVAVVHVRVDPKATRMSGSNYLQ